MTPEATLRVPIPAGVSMKTAAEVVELLTRNPELLRRISDLLGDQPCATAQESVIQVGRVEALWRRIEAKWGALNLDEAIRVSGSDPSNDQQTNVSALRSRGIVGVSRSGELRFPAFQFTPSGSVRTHWAEIVQVLTQAQWSDEDIVLWAASPNGWLDGRIPAEVLETDPATVLRAADIVAPGTGI